jgi:hypothetical protein
MKTLAEYLAEYIRNEFEREWDQDISRIERWVEEGIEAYQSTENCDIVVTGGDCPDCGKSMIKGSDTMFSLTGDRMEVGLYSCECGYEIQY